MHDDMYADTASSGAAAAAPPPPSPWPKLVLDSGASIHVVGDPKLLSNLRDAPAGMTVRVANGDKLPVTKIGDIEMAAAGFTIPGVHLAPGLKSDLISVRVLTRSRICTWFDGDRASLYAGPDLVGVAAAAPRFKNGLYVLQSLSVPKTAAAGECLDFGGEMTLVWNGSSAHAPRPAAVPVPETKHFTWRWSQVSRVLGNLTRKQLLVIALFGSILEIFILNTISSYLV